MHSPSNNKIKTLFLLIRKSHFMLFRLLAYINEVKKKNQVKQVFSQITVISTRLFILKKTLHIINVIIILVVFVIIQKLWIMIK